MQECLMTKTECTGSSLNLLPETQHIVRSGRAGHKEQVKDTDIVGELAVKLRILRVAFIIHVGKLNAGFLEHFVFNVIFGGGA